MFGLFTLLVAKKSITTRILDIAISTSNQGSSGNKGSVSIRFRVCDTTFCFLNCHLEHGQGIEKTNKRFQQLRDIMNYSFKSERGSHT